MCVCECVLCSNPDLSLYNNYWKSDRLENQNSYASYIINKGKKTDLEHKQQRIKARNMRMKMSGGQLSSLILPLLLLICLDQFERTSCLPQPSLKFFGPSHPSAPGSSQLHRQPSPFSSFLNSSSLTKSIQGATAQPSTGESHEYTRHLREVLENEKFRGLADLLRQSTACPDCVCGLSHREERIVGGEVAEINSYPWLAALEYRTKFYCGATLISNRYVLTAAHCVHGVPKDQITIVFGEHDRNVTHESPTHYRKIETIIRHRSFNRANFHNDIAVLRMDKPIRFSRYIAPACLPIDLEDEDFAEHKAMVAGWGRTAEKGKPSTILREVEVPIITNEECISPEYSHYTSREITSAMMCAGYVEGKLDACQGDSGGPLNWERDDDTSKEGVKYVIGIVSWGQGCARSKYPGIYTRITKYLDWIRENTLDSCFCSNP